MATGPAGIHRLSPAARARPGGHPCRGRATEPVPRGPTRPGPPAGARVWIVDLALGPEALAACDAILSATERARADRFLRAEDRDRYRASHAALRLILGRALGAEPRALAFAAEPHGKPALAGRHRGALAFNLSHSGRRALVGLSPGAAIGVDVETLRALPDALRIARGHFAPDEAAALAARPESERAATFVGLWTRKEAVVKALGTGLALPLDRFSVTLPPNPPRILRADGDPRAWTLCDVPLGPAHAGTAAVAAAGRPPEIRTLPEGWPADLA